MNVFLRSIPATSLAILFMLVLTACGSGRYTILEPANQRLTDYGVLEIAPFQTSLTAPEAMEVADRFAGRLHQAVSEYRLQHPNDLVYREITLGTEQSADVLLMEGTLISYEEGSRAKRYFIGFGSGKAFCTIQVKFVDKASGQEISRTKFDGELSMGLFGGSADEAVDALVESFIDYMRQYMGTGAA